jgi:hypothetical protein
MKHKKNVVDSAKKRPNLCQVGKVKINYLFLMVQELIINFLMKPCNFTFLQKR